MSLLPAPAVAARYAFLVYRGNNSELVKRALLRRPWWRDANPMSAEEEAMLDSDMLEKAASEAPAAAGDALPALLRNKRERRAAAAREQDTAARVFAAGAFDFLWRPTQSLRLDGAVLTVHSRPTAGAGGCGAPEPEPQLVNHFPCIKHLTTKSGLLRSLRGYYAPRGIDLLAAHPTTFLVRNLLLEQTEDAAALGWAAFRDHFRAMGAGGGFTGGVPARHCRKNVWIVKPAFLNQGRGIEVFAEISKIKAHLSGVRGDGEWLIQKYIEQPLLLWGRKFDIRCWVLLDESYNIWIYRDGYLRTSSETFSLEFRGLAKDSNKMVHLTNYCMQKHSKNLGKFEEGNTLSFDDLQVCRRVLAPLRDAAVLD